jgi:regulatory protein YycI of two-component signal transduction system YycFG
MNKLSLKSMVFIIIFLLVGIFFVIDPFNWWPLEEVGIPCNSMSLSPRCAGKITFPWQHP